MHSGHIVIVMIKFEIMTSSWILDSKLLCWELDTKNNHEMEYDSWILVSDSSVSPFCQEQFIFRKSLLCFINAAFLQIKNDKEKVIRKPLICQ